MQQIVICYSAIFFFLILIISYKIKQNGISINFSSVITTMKVWERWLLNANSYRTLVIIVNRSIYNYKICN